MKIHSSSLLTPPANSVGTAVSKVARVQNKVTHEESKANPKQPVIEISQTPEEIEHILTQAGLTIYDESGMKDVLNNPVPTRIKQALSAYDTQRNQSTQNQRAELVIGIDFYV